MEPEEMALAVLRIVNNNMVGALRTVLTERGLDPRDFSLLAFGGAGPLHVSDLMAEAGIPTGIVPIHPGQFSALGFTLADARFDIERTVQMTSARFDAQRATATLAELVRSGRDNLASQGYMDRLQILRSVELRYLGQNYELEVAIDFDEFTAPNTARMWQGFHDLHAARFGFNIPNETIEVITLKTTIVSVTDKPAFDPLPVGAAPAPLASRRVVFDVGALETPVYRRSDLCAGARIDGPALIEEPTSVTVLRPEHRLHVTPNGHLIITSDRE
jgi:N-methylhydantoinase A